MRLGSIVMLLVALVFGLAAALLAKTWLEARQPVPPAVVEAPAVRVATLVVAREPLRFGSELSPANLREIDWPKAALPDGAFSRISDLLRDGRRPVALAAIEVNEPVLAAKITGPGQRASLSAVIDDGMKAVAIRVTDVQGVAGFVLPGERVDVLLTRLETQRSGDTVSQERAYTDVLLQNVRVLAVDQSADERTDKPAVVKAVTIEVTTEQAQKLTLAGSVGQLSLILRAAGSTAAASTRRISLGDLGVQAGPAPAAGDSSVRVGVVRGLDRSVYSVPTHRHDLIN